MKKAGLAALFANDDGPIRFADPKMEDAFQAWEFQRWCVRGWLSMLLAQLRGAA